MFSINDTTVLIRVGETFNFTFKLGNVMRYEDLKYPITLNKSWRYYEFSVKLNTPMVATRKVLVLVTDWT